MQSGTAAQKTAREVVLQTTSAGLVLEASEHDLVMLFTHAGKNLLGYTESAVVQMIFPSSEGGDELPQGVVRLCLVLAKDVTVREDACTQPVLFTALRQIADGTVMSSAAVREASYAVSGALVHVMVDLEIQEIASPSPRPPVGESFGCRVKRTLVEEYDSDWMIDLRMTAASDSDKDAVLKTVAYLLSLTDCQCRPRVVLSGGKYTVTIFGATSLAANHVTALSKEMSVRLVDAWVCAERRIGSGVDRVPTIALSIVVELRSDVPPDGRRPSGRKTGRYTPYAKDGPNAFTKWLPWRS